MKKNTLIKLLCLALVCMLVLPMVVACGGGAPTKRWTVTLDPNGGELPEDAIDEFEVDDEDRIGKLPNPTRKGYTFLGWYDIDDTAMSEKITRSFEVEYDIDLVAHWTKNTENPLTYVTFKLGPGETMDGETVISLEAGDRLNSVLTALPVPEKADYNFVEWVDANGKPVTLISVINGDTVLTPTWKQIVYCLDGTENHDWGSGGGWKIKTEASCTDPEVRERTCAICKIPETLKVGEALGHKYDWNDDVPMQRTGICSVCQDVSEIKFVDVTLKAMGKGNPVIDSAAGWGNDMGASLIDGNWDDKPFAGNQKPVTVTLDFESNTVVDLIYVAGQGSAGYIITWYDVNGEELGYDRGGFGSKEAGTYISAFEVGAEISKVVVYMETPSYGADFWGEIRLAQYPAE